MQALRLIISGWITSFRYPHFVHGVQPSYDMPPPATLYGHVCSALGERVLPDSFRIAMHFTYRARWRDYEHTHLFSKAPKLSPFERELLFKPRLILYVDRPEWLDHFRQPKYVVTLGRSQDLMCIESATVVNLQVAEQSYIEHTLLPLQDAQAVQQYSAITMPRYIDPDRVVNWQTYAQVTQTQPLLQAAWIDQAMPTWRGYSRSVHWLSFYDQAS